MAPLITGTARFSGKTKQASVTSSGGLTGSFCSLAAKINSIIETLGSIKPSSSNTQSLPVKLKTLILIVVKI